MLRPYGFRSSVWGFTCLLSSDQGSPMLIVDNSVWLSDQSKNVVQFNLRSISFHHSDALFLVWD